jgi:hypothetical protein
MDGPTIARIIEASRALEPEEQGWFIATEAIKASRAADAAITDQALEADLQAWWKHRQDELNAIHPLTPPSFHAVSTHVAWARHLLSRGRHG